MKKTRICFTSCFAVLACSLGLFGQIAADYDTLVQQGHAQLQAGNNDLALTTAQAAIKANADHWEAYALAGAALMNKRSYEQAADKLSEAIKRAPESKQAGLRELRRQCLLSESGAPTAQSQAAVTQDEVVLWKSIENSTNPSDFQSYLDQYPQGAFVSLARRHLDEVNAMAEHEKEIARLAAQQQKERQIALFSWTDTTSGLMWEKTTGDQHLLTFTEANEYCSKLRLLDYSDWRLPTADEAQAVVAHFSHAWGVTLKGDIQGFQWIALWTSTAGDRDGEHITIHGNSRRSANDTKTGHSGQFYGNGALCVRNTQPSDRESSAAMVEASPSTKDVESLPTKRRK